MEVPSLTIAQDSIRLPDNHSLYTTDFYAGQSDSSYAAAMTLLPAVLEAVQPASVVDVGCGTGAWLAACRKLGVTRTVGIEGSWVREAELRDPEISLVTADLEQPIALQERFDLAMSLEVAEHLSEARADSFIADIARLSPVVLFGAAIPGQGGGFHHVNEQWQSYWRERFEAADYTAIDLLRPRFWEAHDVPVHYRQNTFLYVHSSVAARFGALIERTRTTFPTNVVHPGVHVANVAALHAPPTLSQALGAALDIPSALWRSLARRIARRRGDA